MDYQPYKNKYIGYIKDYIDKRAYYPEHKIYEILWAIDKNMILWDDIPPNFSDFHYVPNNRDYGIDLINLDFNKSCQAKLYGKNSSITFKHMSTFYAMSSGLMDINDMTLLTTNEAKIVDHSMCLIQKNDIKLIRMDFKDLLDKVSATESFKNHQQIYKKDTNIKLKIEKRDYLIECNEIISTCNKEIIRCQLPCGTGKSYIMLYAIRKELKKNSKSKFIIFCPWRDLAYHIYT